MNDRITLAITVAVVLSMIVVPGAALAQEQTPTATVESGDEPTETPADETETNDSEGSTTESEAGAQLAGVVGVQNAEVSGEVEARAYGFSVARAQGNNGRAGVVADTVNESNERLAELKEKRVDLEEKRANGNISEGRYRAEMAQLAAQVNQVERMAKKANETAQGLPAEALESKSINADEIKMLKNNASELSGQEVAELARGIAGENPGKGLGQENRPDNAGPDNDNDSDARDRGNKNGNDDGDARDRGNGDNDTNTTDSPDGDAPERENGDQQNDDASSDEQTTDEETVTPADSAEEQ